MQIFLPFDPNDISTRYIRAHAIGLSLSVRCLLSLIGISNGQDWNNCSSQTRRSEVTRTPISRVQPASSFIPAIHDLNYLFGSHLFIRFTRKRMAKRKFTPCKDWFYARKIKRKIPLSYLRCIEFSLFRYFRKNTSREGEKASARVTFTKWKSKKGFFAFICRRKGESECRNACDGRIAAREGESHFQRVTLHIRFRIEWAQPIPSRFRPAWSKKCINVAELWVTARHGLFESTYYR